MCIQQLAGDMVANIRQGGYDFCKSFLVLFREYSSYILGKEEQRLFGF
jgi:hypothetical protein